MRPCAHVKAVVDDDRAVLLDLRRGKYFAVNEVGVDIWRGLERGLSRNEIERSLCSAYDVSPATAQADVARFIAMLEQDKLVEHDA